MSITLAKKEQAAITEILASEILDNEQLDVVKRRVAKKHKISIPTNAKMLKILSRKTSETASRLRKLLRKRAVRTMSGIAPVAVLTKPWPCPGKCAYCPTEKDVPQSYLSNEPAVMRAIREEFDPYDQVQGRLRALEANGHEPTKIELIVIGGTWSVLDEEYKYHYITECFRAANDFGVKSLKLKVKRESKKAQFVELKKQLNIEQKRNEKANYKIIGVTLETRPDYINEAELWQMREFGCTRVELGVQAIDDKILALNKRGHGVDRITEATKLLRDFGFKVTYHLMPGLPGSTAVKDLKMFKQLFSDERFQPDQIKFYPTVVTHGSLLYHWWKAGKYKPYSQKVLEKLIIDCKLAVPRYVRIIRLIRDIPGVSILAGNIVTNLRQVMQQRGTKCDCIRCREVKGQEVKSYKLKVISYKAAGGIEYFIEAVGKDKRTLYGFCRLRLPSHNVEFITRNVLSGAALIRELHVYGELVSMGGEKKVQHAGLGKILMLEAEKIARKNKYEKIVVISGVGVRGYYRKLGYKLKQTYLVKVI